MGIFAGWDVTGERVPDGSRRPLFPASRCHYCKRLNIISNKLTRLQARPAQSARPTSLPVVAIISSPMHRLLRAAPLALPRRVHAFVARPAAFLRLPQGRTANTPCLCGPLM